ncbi:hypothetical protein Ae201684_009051 [Aphanomyces euteiches]|uniref:Uncharacterized protein n=1 Tax=Aphanomyces euteiches TaxID=100861 RepID=A0A6G0X2Y8_9STRA|nr:hypothetical protein Ae201684_009051 [Aphanomyces euteiches]
MCTNTLSARDCSLAQAAGRGNVVSFVGHDYLPLTNGVGFCDFVYGDSSLNSTCSRGMKSIGPGIKKKDGIMRDHSVQALILVTSTTCINALLKNLAISWCVPLQRQKLSLKSRGCVCSWWILFRHRMAFGPSYDVLHSTWSKLLSHSLPPQNVYAANTACPSGINAGNPAMILARVTNETKTSKSVGPHGEAVSRDINRQTSHIRHLTANQIF